MTLDPDQNFVFAAGQDSRVRAWSTRTGAQLLPPTADGEDQLLDHVFPRPILGMKVDGEGRLWAASGDCIQRFDLGRVRV